MLQLGLIVLFLTVAGALWARWRWNGYTVKQKKRMIKRQIGSVFTRGEEKGAIARTPAFDHDYLRDYPSLKVLEDNYPTVRRECLELLGIKEQLTDMSAMGGKYTKEGIHTAKWKTFMFKSGKWVEPNCRRCPGTAALIKQIPEAYTAFFSILEPDQYITPHKGYYKGFLRYHLGVIIPNDNVDSDCWLRVNSDPDAQKKRERHKIAEGETYYWKDGEGILFNDNYTHDAANNSQETRVVLWIDIARKLPFFYHWFNRLCLFFIYREPGVRKIRRIAEV
jgi:aspartyl/asparaginyl beta-hydroxylase (cupin superfamily)